MKLRSVGLRNRSLDDTVSLLVLSSMKLRSVGLRNAAPPSLIVGVVFLLNEVAKRGASQSPKRLCRPSYIPSSMKLRSVGLRNIEHCSAPSLWLVLNEVAKRGASQLPACGVVFDGCRSSMKLRSVGLRNALAMGKPVGVYHPQ